MSEELKQLREALRRVKYEATSLADAQVIALEALTHRPAGQATPEPLTGCNCRWKGDTQVEWCEHHRAHLDAIHEWAQRAKSAEARLKATPEPVGAPFAWTSMGQIRFTPPTQDHDTYTPLYTHPAPGVPDGVLDAKYFARNGTGFDTCPTRLLPQSEEARKVDEWWLRYFAAADAQVRKHALTMLAAAQAKGGDHG